jgi:clan AA aspartic protease (TIGR02281 family)
MSGRLLRALIVSLLLASAASSEWEGGARSEVPLEGNGKSWFVRATLDGRVDGLFLLDTGASVCVLAPATARRLKPRTTGAEVELHTANGVIHAPIVELRSVDVGGNRARDVQAVVHDGVPGRLDGIIGLSFLDHFTYGIDPRRRILRLH